MKEARKCPQRLYKFVKWSNELRKCFDIESQKAFCEPKGIYIYVDHKFIANVKQLFKLGQLPMFCLWIQGTAITMQDIRISLEQHQCIFLCNSFFLSNINHINSLYINCWRFILNIITKIPKKTLGLKIPQVT